MLGERAGVRLGPRLAALADFPSADQRPVKMWRRARPRMASGQARPVFGPAFPSRFRRLGFPGLASAQPGGGGDGGPPDWMRASSSRLSCAVVSPVRAALAAICL